VAFQQRLCRQGGMTRPELLGLPRIFDRIAKCGLKLLASVAHDNDYLRNAGSSKRPHGMLRHREPTNGVQALRQFGLHSRPFAGGKNDSSR
jgi:hypothetical protein